MKKVFVLTIVLLLVQTVDVLAQRNYRPEIAIGGNASLNLSQVNLQPKVKQAMLLGPKAGITFRYIEEKHFGFQLELNYSQQGWDELFEDEPYSYTRTFNYIELPFLTHIFFGNRKVRGFVNLGPRIAYFISDKYNANFDIHNPPEIAAGNYETAQYTSEVAHKFDYGICGGAGFELRIGKGSYIIEGRYYYGLADFFKNRKRDHFTASSHRVISVGFCYLFHLK